MAEITFLAPGSCQLEVTAQGTTGTDTGVDLASVSWTIEQALIAGCGFAPSPGDVHIDRNGVLTIGRSLFDRINQAAGDDAIPGQCTLIIRADSTITDNVLDRFKVLVGYPGEGGGGGGGDSDFTTATVTMQAAEGFHSTMTLECACIASDDGSPEATSTSAYTAETSKEFTAILYKGKALAFNPVPDGVNLTATGNVEQVPGEDSGLYIITGDCTFTFANA